MLARCPACNYSLTGLPDRHKCPECGFSYDKRMEVLMLALRKQVFWIVVCTLALLGLAAFFALRGGLASIPMITYAMILFYPLYGFYLWKKREHDKILLWQDGLQVIRKSQQSPVYSWHDIQLAKKSVVDGYAFLLLQNGDKVKLFDRKFFGSDRGTRKFVSRINNWKSESAGSSACRTSCE